MLVKVLDENRIKILMEDQDVDLYNLPFERINEEETAVRSFIYDLLEKAREETGIDLNNSSLMVEVIPGVSRSYYILITRIPGEGNEKIEFEHNLSFEPEMYLFLIDNGSDLLCFINQLKLYPPEKIEVFYFQKKYYVMFSYDQRRLESYGFSSFLLRLEEFGKRCRFHSINIGLLREWGEQIDVLDL